MARSLIWTPGYGQAGLYQGVRLSVSDGTATVTRSFDLKVVDTNAPPVLRGVPDRIVREGDTVTIRLAALDFDGDTLLYSTSALPPGAQLNPSTGEFSWIVGYDQAGTYRVPFVAYDGTWVTQVATTITVLNRNAAPIFEPLGRWEIVEGQPLSFFAFAVDPDNPGYVPPQRDLAGNLLETDGGTPPSVTYTVEELPPGASFDPITTEFSFRPTFGQAGDYAVTFIATDDGNGTGTPAVSRVTVPIRVGNVNRPPVLGEIGNQTVAAGELLRSR